MPNVDVEETKLVGATPEKVYAILVEPEHHRQILPDAFLNYTEEPDGTFSLTVKVGVITRKMHIRAEQVEQNKLYREVDLHTGIVIDFRLEPHPDGTLVTLATHYQTKGLTGYVEALFAPIALRKGFDEELTKLCRYALVAKL